MSRKAKILRKTKETNIAVEVNLDGVGKYQIKTQIGFLDHMLEQLSKHSLIDLKILAFLIIFFAKKVALSNPTKILAFL